VGDAKDLDRDESETFGTPTEIQLMDDEARSPAKAKTGGNLRRMLPSWAMSRPAYVVTELVPGRRRASWPRRLPTS